MAEEESWKQEEEKQLNYKKKILQPAKKNIKKGAKEKDEMGK